MNSDLKAEPDESKCLNMSNSSNIIESIKVVFFFFSFTKRLHTHEKHKNTHKQTKTKKAVLNALKKHLRGK